MEEEELKGSLPWVGLFIPPQTPPSTQPPAYMSSPNIPLSKHGEADPSSTEDIEYKGKGEDGNVVIVSARESREPESLRGLEPAELEAMTKKLVRKMDLVIL